MTHDGRRPPRPTLLRVRGARTLAGSNPESELPGVAVNTLDAWHVEVMMSSFERSGVGDQLPLMR